MVCAVWPLLFWCFNMDCIVHSVIALQTVCALVCYLPDLSCMPHYAATQHPAHLGVSECLLANQPTGMEVAGIGALSPSLDVQIMQSPSHT